MSDQNQDNLGSSMTPNQKQFSHRVGAFKRYRELLSGSEGYVSWFFLELYFFLIAPLPGFIGLGLRAFFSRFLFASVGSAPAIEQGVRFRSPKNIFLGSGVIIDHGALLDSRKSNHAHPEIRLGDNCFIGSGSMIIAKGGGITLGNAVNVSTNCRIASEGPISIGNSVLVSAYCYIGPGNHIISDTNKSIMEQGMEPGKGISIGDNCWIGTRVTILDGVKIGSGSVIGAHSLVREDVPENAIVAGCPARVIRVRE
ncbi:MAG TPA: acyltransferase [Oligoflexia bacterium]|nr:acyltransferase [Oligoflexia bacterium]HMP49879.1 acyltransferase [Oligoflexia bacterium]